MRRSSKKCYVLSSTVAFVPHPLAANLWVRTHACTIVAACPVCDAPAGKLCEGRDGPLLAGTHYARRRAARAELLKLVPYTVVHTPEPA